VAFFTELHPAAPELRRSPELDRYLEEEIQWEIEMIFSDRHPQEVEWREDRRQYAARPRNAYKNTPVPNAPNVEVPLGAIASDALYAQMTTVLYSGNPLLTARAQDENWTDNAKAAQRWVNYVAEQEVNLRLATDHAFTDCIQMGTSAYYVPFTETIKNTRVNRVTNRGPMILPIAPENILCIGGSRGRIQDDRMFGIRWWLSPGEMRVRAKYHGWDMERTMPCAQVDWVRRQHELVNLTNSSNAWREQFEVIELFLYHDYHRDGNILDLHVYFDRSSQRVLSVDFNEYDERPVELMRYQVRPHLAYGLGVMEMLRPFQNEASDVHNHRLLNMLIANTRMWVATDGAVPETLEVWPNKVTFVKNGGELQGLQLGDVYPSSVQAEEIVDGLAQRRVGTEGGIGTGAPAPHSIGTRTPGITAMTQMQAANARFTPAFDSMRLATCGALRQCLLRQREQLLTKDKQIEQHIQSVLGPEDGQLVVDLLTQADFDRYVQVEFTAVSPQTNAAADQQAMTLLWQTASTQYYKPIMEMIAAVSAPGASPALVDVARQIAEKSTELFDRYLRTFDQTRDPKTFLLDLSQNMEAVAQERQQGAQQEQLQGLIESLTGNKG
jgi:hypothetical protein